jgi:hypothetical protein
MAERKVGLRLMVYDRTCGGPWGLPGLTFLWRLGGVLYRVLGRLDDWKGVASWPEALDWLLARSRGERIAEIQFWGHGNWGCVLIDRVPLDVKALEPGHPWRARLEELRERLVTGGEALWWFRTCETFGTARGHAFARAWTRFFGCRAAGHTYVIGPWQSGLHCLGPGAEPHWPMEEGVPPVERAGMRHALWSGPRVPHTITCLHGRVPPGF